MVLAYTILVVLFGAVVRITGSGAGCGQHWPTCQGEVVHLPQSTEAAIEFTHRLTSGVSVLLVVALPIGAWRVFPRSHPVRHAALASALLMLVEALIGAALVLFRLVADDISPARAIILPLHLTNTSLLLGAVAAVVWGSGTAALQLRLPQARVEWLIVALLGVVLGTSATGAVTALGDTVLPVAELTSSASPHFLERFRAVHPFVAVGAALALFGAAPVLATARPQARAWVYGSVALAVSQLAVGVVNVLLRAPGWMQVVHLAVAVLLWLALVGVWFAASEHRPSERTHAV